MSEHKAIIIFIIIVITAVIIAVAGILFNIKKPQSFLKTMKIRMMKNPIKKAEIKIDNHFLM